MRGTWTSHRQAQPARSPGSSSASIPSQASSAISRRAAVRRRVVAVSYDFDAAEPGGRLMAVTIVNRAHSGPEFEQPLATRKAAVAACERFALVLTIYAF